MQIGPWRPLGVGLVVGKRLRRLRHRCSSLALSGNDGLLPNTGPALNLRLPNDLRRSQEPSPPSSPVPDLQCGAVIPIVC